jgi:hypothetical protein
VSPIAHFVNASRLKCDIVAMVRHNISEPVEKDWILDRVVSPKPVYLISEQTKDNTNWEAQIWLQRGVGAYFEI